jgi:hypothetical protein
MTGEKAVDLVMNARQKVLPKGWVLVVRPGIQGQPSPHARLSCRRTFEAPSEAM